MMLNATGQHTISAVMTQPCLRMNAPMRQYAPTAASGYATHLGTDGL